jgi:hypothetical protein
MIDNRIQEFMGAMGISRVEPANRVCFISPYSITIQCGRLVPYSNVMRKLAQSLRITSKILFEDG